MTSQQTEALALGVSLIEQMRKDNETLFNLVTIYTNNVTRMIVLLDEILRTQNPEEPHDKIK